MEQSAFFFPSVVLFLLSPCLLISKMVCMQIVVVDHADVISMQVNFKAYIFVYLHLVLNLLVEMTVYAWM